MRRAGAAARGIAAIITLAAATIALPLALYRLGGSPLPGHLPGLHQAAAALLRRDNGSLFLAAVRDLSWLAWAAFTLAVAGEAQAAARGRQAPRMAGLGALQGAAGRLVATAALAFSAPSAVIASAAAAPAAAPAAAQLTAAVTTLSPAGAIHPEAPLSTVVAHNTVTVRPGDCLWTIAQRYLGAGDRYPEIARLNLGRDMGAGHLFTNPRVIEPGWQLLLPGRAPAPPPPSASAGSPAAHHETHPSHDPHFGRPHPAATAIVAVPAAQSTAEPPPSASPASGAQAYPLGAAFTAGMLAGGAAVTLARMRRRQRQRRRPGRRIPLPVSPAARRAEQQLVAASPPIPVTALRAALGELAAGLAGTGLALPAIAGIHLAPGLLEVLLATPAAAPPPGPYRVAPGRRGMVWHLDLPADAPARPGAAPAGDLMPGLFAAGVTEAGGHLLLDAEAMQVTTCDGSPAIVDQVLATIAAELATSQWSSWYDLILVGCGELEPTGRAETCASVEEALALLELRSAAVRQRRAGQDAVSLRQLRLADPGDEDLTLSLLVSRIPPSPEQLRRLLELADAGGIAAIVAGDGSGAAPAALQLTGDPARPADITALITPLEVTVRPLTLTAADYESLAGLFAVAADLRDVGPDEPPYDAFATPPWLAAPPSAGSGPEALDLPGPPAAALSGHPEPEPDGAPEPEPGPALGAAGPLAVAVLGPLEITGAATALQPKQAELVLALALNSPSGLTNSALCTILGTDPDHPKPSDSVRQIITRTRRRLGRAADGSEYIQHAGNGRYVLHDAAVLDWSSFRGLAAQGRAAGDPEYLRQALGLIRGRPFDGVYHWWLDVALQETVRAEVIDTAELLAGLELLAGDPAAAGRAARVGLSVDVAAEQLWRALMRAEAAAGNLAGVRMAWKRCLDAIADIDPEGEPDPDTAELYRQLAAAVSGDRVPAGYR